MAKKLTKEEFIKRAREIHGDRYDYSKVEYVNSQTNVCIICPEHGEFWQTPNNHLRGKGCNKCGRSQTLNSITIVRTEEFIRRARKIHGNEYDYSKTNINGMNNPVCITCPKHGDFFVLPHNHLKGKKCKYCATHQSFKKSTNEFINDAKTIHGEKYNYSKVEYVNAKTPVCIICPKHGEFQQTPHKHLSGSGCKWCAKEKSIEAQIMGKDEFIKRAQKCHGSKYIYSNVDYVNNRTKVSIICPEHGEFQQTPEVHLKGYGCRYCSNVSVLEKIVKQIFLENNINFIEQKGFPWLKSEHDWSLKYDFYIPEYNVAVECQGIQHFKPISFFGGEATFNETIKRDAAKRKLSEEHGVKLIYFSTLTIDFPYEVITNTNVLLKEIKKESVL